MQDVVVDKRQFWIKNPRNAIEPIAVKYIAQPPRKQLITLDLWKSWTEYSEFYLPLPWVIYEWTLVPHINPECQWMMNAMYFSPTSLENTLWVSAPCLPNFYGTAPCCGPHTSKCQKDYLDPAFIVTFWEETFNYDGSLLESLETEHPIFTYLAEKAGCPDYKKTQEVYEVFSYWETLSTNDLISLNWPQNLLLPECSRRL